MLVGIALTLLTPVVARFNVYLLIVVRAVIGASMGFVFPCVSNLLGIWAPPLERSFLTCFVFSGLNIGPMIAFLISSQICKVTYDNGWPLSFYVTGGIAILFFILWNVLVFNTPDQHPRISEKELAYIKSRTESKSVSSKKRKPFPVKEVLSSPAFIVVIIAGVPQLWFLAVQSTSLPFYYKDVLRFEMGENGLFMIFSYLIVMVTGPPTAYVADLVRKRKILKTVTVRKLLQAIGSFGAVALLIVISFLDYETRYVSVSLLIVLPAFSDVSRYGFLVNPQDIAPRYSGELNGILSTVATVASVLAPTIVVQLTPKGTQKEWMSIFYITAALFFVGGVLFLIFAKGEPLPWALQEEDNVVVMEVVLNDDRSGTVTAESSSVEQNCANGDLKTTADNSEINSTGDRAKGELGTENHGEGELNVGYHGEDELDVETNLRVN